MGRGRGQPPSMPQAEARRAAEASAQEEAGRPEPDSLAQALESSTAEAMQAGDLRAAAASRARALELRERALGEGCPLVLEMRASLGALREAGNPHLEDPLGADKDQEAGSALDGRRVHFAPHFEDPPSQRSAQHRREVHSDPKPVRGFLRGARRPT